jgi:DNA-binding MarR family transcriptional regulator
MQEPTTRDLARYIFTNGRLIHERIMKVQTSCLQSCCEGPGSFAELSLNQIHAIMAVRRRGEVNMTELSTLLGVSPASASGMVDRLVDKGILVRQHCEEDRRRVKVRVSPEAIDQIRRIEDAVLESFFEIVEGLGRQTAQQWCNILGKIKQVLDKDVA